MNIKIGEKISFGGEEFIVVKVNRDDTMNGKIVYITGFDPALADNEQQKSIKTEQVQDSMVDVIQKLLKKGGEGGFGINLGG
jgi:hypothetical protein